MANFQRSFDFNPGTLETNLATIDDKVDRFINDTLDEAAIRGEESMKTKAPWQDHTFHARTTLWSDTFKSRDRKAILLGHGAEYGIYLEKANEGRFQIVMPILLDVAEDFMRSLEHMFAQLETHTRASVPSVGSSRGTSQRATDRTKPALNVRGERGRFADQGKGYSKAAKAAKAAAKLAAKTATAVTKRTKRTRRG